MSYSHGHSHHYNEENHHSHNSSIEPVFEQSQSQGVYVFQPRRGGSDPSDWNLNETFDDGGKDKSSSFGKVLNTIWMDRDAKYLFVYIVGMLFFISVELLYGMWYNSLGLISDAFHTIFDVFAMLTSLIAMILSRRTPTKDFTYGYDRLEILSGFTNGAFLLFVSVFIFVESFERLLEPEELHGHGRVIGVAILGLCVNVVGVLFFRHHTQTRSEIRSRARQENVGPLFTHIFMDMLSSIGIIISSWLVEWKGWHLADTLVSIGIAIVIVYTAFPICLRTGRVLLQTTPESIWNLISKGIRDTGMIEGVLDVSDEHFWTQSPGVFVGSLKIRVRSDSHEQTVLRLVTSLFSNFITHLTIQIEKDNWTPQATIQSIYPTHSPTLSLDPISSSASLI